ncbi:DNA gyrase inhibitor YacG [Yoonia sp.]|uniref:DNA gyrase inhibitor YacG n=1 Tax=Yoonia sp. TaxID=2212373 RepID=UPI00391D2629
MACPICDRPTEKAFRPFCSKRCADVDLGKWLTGSYAIPAMQDDAEEGETAPIEDDDGKLH